MKFKSNTDDLFYKTYEVHAPKYYNIVIPLFQPYLKKQTRLKNFSYKRRIRKYWKSIYFEEELRAYNGRIPLEISSFYK